MAKLRNISYIIKEIVINTSTTNYELNGIVGNNLEFYGLDKITGNYKELPKAWYQLIKNNGNYVLNVVDPSIFNYSKIQVALWYDNKSLTYVTEFNPDIKVLVDRYNILVNTVSELWEYTKRQTIVGDSMDMHLILPRLNKEELWICKGDHYEAISLVDVNAELRKLIDKYANMYKVELEQKANEGKIAINKYVKELEAQQKNELENYKNQKIAELLSQLVELKAQFDSYVLQKQNEMSTYKENLQNDLYNSSKEKIDSYSKETVTISVNTIRSKAQEILNGLDGSIKDMVQLKIDTLFQITSPKYLKELKDKIDNYSETKIDENMTAIQNKAQEILENLDTPIENAVQSKIDTLFAVTNPKYLRELKDEIDDYSKRKIKENLTSIRTKAREILADLTSSLENTVQTKVDTIFEDTNPKYLRELKYEIDSYLNTKIRENETVIKNKAQEILENLDTPIENAVQLKVDALFKTANPRYLRELKEQIDEYTNNELDKIHQGLETKIDNYISTKDKFITDKIEDIATREINQAVVKAKKSVIDEIESNKNKKVQEAIKSFTNQSNTLTTQKLKLIEESVNKFVAQNIKKAIEDDVNLYMKSFNVTSSKTNGKIKLTFTSKGFKKEIELPDNDLSNEVNAIKENIGDELDKKIDKTSMSDAINSTSSVNVATSWAVKKAYDKAVEALNKVNESNNSSSNNDEIESELARKVDKNAISDSIDSTSSYDVASSWAVKKAYDKAVEALEKANGGNGSSTNKGDIANELAKKIDKSSMSNYIDSNSSNLVATSRAVKIAYDKGVEALNKANDAYDNAQDAYSKGVSALRKADDLDNEIKTIKENLENTSGNKVGEIPKSDSVTSSSSENVATSRAVKTAYDKGLEALNKANDAYDKGKYALERANDANRAGANILKRANEAYSKAEEALNKANKGNGSNASNNELAKKIDKSSMSDAVDSTSSSNVATSKAVRLAYLTGKSALDKASDAYKKAEEALNKSNSSNGISKSDLDKKIDKTSMSDAIDSTSSENVATSRAVWKVHMDVKGALNRAESAYTAADQARSFALKGREEVSNALSKARDAYSKAEEALKKANGGNSANGVSKSELDKKIDKSSMSDAVDSDSSENVATSKAVKIAYDKAEEVSNQAEEAYKKAQDAYDKAVKRAFLMGQDALDRAGDANKKAENALELFENLQSQNDKKYNDLLQKVSENKNNNGNNLKIRFASNSATFLGSDYKYYINTDSGTERSYDFLFKNPSKDIWHNIQCNTLNANNLIVKEEIVSNGNITAFSDIRLKSNIEKIDNALDKISQISGYTYDINNKRSTGVIAQEVEKILPEVVQDREDGYKTVAYGNMIGLLVEAIKELKKEIEVLKNGN